MKSVVIFVISLVFFYGGRYCTKQRRLQKQTPTPKKIGVTDRSTIHHHNNRTSQIEAFYSALTLTNYDWLLEIVLRATRQLQRDYHLKVPRVPS